MKNNKLQIIGEYLRGGISYRDLGKKYGVGHTTIAKWIRSVLSKEKQVIALATDPRAQQRDAPMDVLELQKELRAAQLRNKLLEAMLDIGEEQYGIDLRKKAGTRQS